jgi:hypothetical protein
VACRVVGNVVGRRPLCAAAGDCIFSPHQIPPKVMTAAAVPQIPNSALRSLERRLIRRGCRGGGAKGLNMVFDFFDFMGFPFEGLAIPPAYCPWVRGDVFQ